jgi:hypothetical protein
MAAGKRGRYERAGEPRMKERKIAEPAGRKREIVSNSYKYYYCRAAQNISHL